MIFYNNVKNLSESKTVMQQFSYFLFWCTTYKVF